jgi:hypothetical protein
MSIGPNPPSIIEDCTFTWNFGETGGAIHNGQSISLVNCLLIHNVAAGEGGAVYSRGSRLDILPYVLRNTAPAGLALTCFTPQMNVTTLISGTQR